MAFILENDVNILKIVRNHQVSESLCKLYLNDDMADVFFVFTENDDETERLAAHRTILAAASPVFHQMFFGELRENGNVFITDCSYEGFVEFLQYFYLSDVTLTSDNITEVIQMAHKYDLQCFVTMCIDFLTEYLSHETVFLTLQIAMCYELTELKEICERLICNETKSVFQTDSFPYCSFAVLKKILSMPWLCCSELDLLDAAMQWAKHACFTESDEEPTMDQCKAKLKDCFDLIRFNAMSADEFSACLFNYPGMFPASELERKVICISNYRIALDLRPDGAPHRMKYHHNKDGFIVCSRIASRRSTLHMLDTKQIARFSVNQTILLHGIQLANQTQLPEFPYKERVSRVGHVLTLGAHTQAIEIDLNLEKRVLFSRPITINAGQTYDIILKLNTKCTHFSTVEMKKDPIKIGNSIEFSFKKHALSTYDNVTRGLITDLYFTIPGSNTRSS